MSKLPAFQFYPSDWRSDNGVQALNYFERGVWFEMLCLMHECEQRGKLLLNGNAVSDEALARLLGLDRQALSKTLTTLIEFGVCSRDESGVLYSRRMVRDEAERQANAERQRRHYEKSREEKPNGEPNANLTAIQQKSNAPSSITSSSSKKDTSVSKKATRIPAQFEVTEAMREWAKKNAPNVGIERETVKFKDYYATASGKNAVGLDWTAKWRTWFNNAQGWWEEKNPRAPEPTPEEDDLAARYEAAEKAYYAGLARPTPIAGGAVNA